MKGIAGFLLFLFTCTASAQTRSPIDLANAQVSPGARRIAYGTDPLQFGEGLTNALRHIGSSALSFLY